MPNFVNLKNKYLNVGLMLDDDYAQVSYSTHISSAPVTLGQEDGGNILLIPVLLYRRPKEGLWFFGSDAAHFARKGLATRGSLVSSLLKLACLGEAVVVGDASYSPLDLLALFLRRLLALLCERTGGTIRILTITVRELDQKTLATLKAVSNELKLTDGSVCLESFAESCFHYIFNQAADIWHNANAICDFTGRYIKMFLLDIKSIGEKTVAAFDSRQIEDFETTQYLEDESLDEMLSAHLNSFFTGHFISSVFFCGKFERAYLGRDSLKKFFSGKRAFLGSNLYSKGAAYSAAAKLGGRDNVLLIGDGRLRVNIGLQLLRDGHLEYKSLLTAGLNKDEAVSDTNIIVYGRDFIDLVFSSPYSDVLKTGRISLNELPERRKGRTILNLKMEMIGDRIVRARFTDLGCGELSPSSGLVWEKDIKLG